MSKYEEIRDACIDREKAVHQYFDICAKFAEHLLRGLVNYLGWPEKQVKYIPSSEKIVPIRIYTIKGAMVLKNDTFWHIGVLITIIDPSDKSVINNGLLPLLIRKEADKFVVGIEGTNKTYKIDVAIQNEFEGFYEYVFKVIKDHFEKGLERIQGKTINRIGFIE